MPLVWADRVRETSATSGTGAITPNGVFDSSFKTITSVLTSGDTAYFVVKDGAGAWNSFLGTWNGTTITRTTILAGSSGTSAVSLSGTGVEIWLDAPADWIGTRAPIASPTFTGTVTIPSGASISGFALLASPTLTGVPAAPTASPGTNTTQVATTAFDTAAVLVETNRALAAEALRAPIASPTFTGTATVPTLTVTGAATVGTTLGVTGAATVGGTLGVTGVLTAPTATTGTSTTQTATTAFVQAQITSSVGTANAEAVKTALNAGGSAPIFSCRAWVNFNGTGTVAIRSSGNVSSITDNGVGDYTVNFTTVMPDANYAVAGTAVRDSGGNMVGFDIQTTATYPQTNSALRVSSGYHGSDAFDASVHVAIFR